MNQDDSLVTPSKDSAGKNMFEAGDYRYALNARIGSSRSDHFGDLENIRDTVEVTEYYAAQNLFTNPTFDGNLDGWLQLDESADHIPWTYNDNAARLTLTPDIGPADEAPAYIGKSSKQSQAGGPSVAVILDLPYPVGIQAGDLLIVAGLDLHVGVGSTASVIVLTSGWTGGLNTAYENSSNQYSGNFCLFTRIATGSESGDVQVQCFCDADHTGQAQMYIFRSASGSPIQIDSTSMNAVGDGAATITFNAVTVSGTHRSLIAMVGGSYGTPADPTGYTEATDDNTILVFIREDVSSDGLITTNGGQSDGWATGHMSIFSEEFVPTAFISEVLYQTITDPFVSQPIVAQFGINSSAQVDDVTISIVFLNGTTIVEEQVVFIGDITDMTFNESLTTPASPCDGIGIRIEGTVSQVITMDLEYFRVVGTFLSPATRPTGTEKVIGKYEDYEFQRLYYCVWNSEGNHCIRYWDA